MKSFRSSAFDPTDQSSCRVKSHRLFLSSYRWHRTHATPLIVCEQS
jgi:hypothetical protein